VSDTPVDFYVSKSDEYQEFEFKKLPFNEALTNVLNQSFVNNIKRAVFNPINLVRVLMSRNMLAFTDAQRKMDYNVDKVREFVKQFV